VLILLSYVLALFSGFSNGPDLSRFRALSFQPDQMLVHLFELGEPHTLLAVKITAWVLAEHQALDENWKAQVADCEMPSLLRLNQHRIGIVASDIDLRNRVERSVFLPVWPDDVVQRKIKRMDDGPVPMHPLTQAGRRIAAEGANAGRVHSLLVRELNVCATVARSDFAPCASILTFFPCAIGTAVIWSELIRGFPANFHGGRVSFFTAREQRDRRVLFIRQWNLHTARNNYDAIGQQRRIGLPLAIHEPLAATTQDCDFHAFQHPPSSIAAQGTSVPVPVGRTLENQYSRATVEKSLNV